MNISLQNIIPLIAFIPFAVASADRTAFAGSAGEIRYEVKNLPSLGGTSSRGNSINERGWVLGLSHLPGDQTGHASLWRDGKLIDLGTLGGPNSNVAWPVKNNRGIIVGIAETAKPDPLGETWSCAGFFPGDSTGHVCRGFVRESGKMRKLPTLGGNNGFATGANNRGQIVGWAENDVHDPTCNLPQRLQFRAVVWGPRKKEIRELPPLGQDTVSAATAINDRGQVIGISGICDNAVGRFSAARAVMWHKGKTIDLGNLGGVSWHTPMAINSRGDVTGFSNLAGDEDGRANMHAFLWTRKDGIRSLGTLYGDTFSQAFGINARGQIVGVSCSAGFAVCRPFLWQDDVMTELNTLVADDYPDQLLSANDISDNGEITGAALVQSTGETVAYIATPRDRR